jgi:membrane protease YdiL (CAAX protease family)
LVEPQRQISYRPVRVLGALLLLQLVGLVSIGVYVFSTIDWDRSLTLIDGQVQTLPGPLEKQLEQAILFVIFFLPPAVLLLVAGLCFLLLRRRGWLLASVAQSVVLLACLFSYPDPRPGFVYPIIAYCILMVLYLNSRDVRAVFHTKRITPASRGSETAHGE